jgi:DNA polymerase-1
MGMKLLALDVETNTVDGANPFSSEGKLVCIGFINEKGVGNVIEPTKFELEILQQKIDEADLILGWNFKFDYHWLRRYGVKLDHKKIWDGQLAYYMLSMQQQRFPSLDDVAYELIGERKEDVVKKEYWQKGIDTDKVPWDILIKYCFKDCFLTLAICQELMAKVLPDQKNLFSLAMQDLHVLQDMEWNGLHFDRKVADELLDKTTQQRDELLTALEAEKVPQGFNWASPKQLSALLYGGTIEFDDKVPDGVFKTGERAGQVKFKRIKIPYTFPRRYKPLKGSESAVEGVYSTDEETLTKLGKEGIVGKILEIRRIEKLMSTYYTKLPQMQEELHWDKNYIYGNFDQTTTATGRLASSKPNLQNFPPEANRLFISRYRT